MMARRSQVGDCGSCVSRGVMWRPGAGVWEAQGVGSGRRPADASTQVGSPQRGRRCAAGVPVPGVGRWGSVPRCCTGPGWVPTLQGSGARQQVGGLVPECKTRSLGLQGWLQTHVTSLQERALAADAPPSHAPYHVRIVALESPPASPTLSTAAAPRLCMHPGSASPHPQGRCLPD
jgi:hypothetical protein